MSTLNTSYDIERSTGVCCVNGRSLEPGEPYFATLVELTDEQILQEREAIAQRHRGETAEAREKRVKAWAALGLRRLDVSVEAWEAGQRPSRLFSFWKTTVPEPEARRRAFVDHHVMVNLVERLGPWAPASVMRAAGLEAEPRADEAEETQSPSAAGSESGPGSQEGLVDPLVRAGFRHAIALLLMRKKLLRFDGTIEAHEGPGAGAAERGTPRAAVWWRFTPKVDVAKGPLGKWDEGRTLLVLDPRLSDEQMASVTEQLGEVLDASL